MDSWVPSWMLCLMASRSWMRWVPSSSSTAVWKNCIAGYRADELTGRPVEFLVPDDVAGAHEGHRSHFRHKPDRRPIGVGLEVSLRRKNGTSLPVDVQLSTIEIGTGPYVLVSVRDTTHRKEVDAALRQSEERFRSFVEAAPVMMFSLLPDGVILSVDGEFELRTGWRRDDLIGTHFAPLVHPDDLGRNPLLHARPVRPQPRDR